MKPTMDSTAPKNDVAAAIGGDREAIQSLWCEHRRWIAAVILAHKAPEDSVDDLLQDVAMTLVSKVNTLREESNIRAWLRVVAVNAARAAARKGRSRPRPAELDYEPEPDRPGHRFGDNVVLDDEARRAMEIASTLPEAYREPLMLRALHGMRGRHIAQILGLTEPTVETRIARARRMLRERMESSLLDSQGCDVVASIAEGAVRKDRA